MKRLTTSDGASDVLFEYFNVCDKPVSMCEMYRQSPIFYIALKKQIFSDLMQI